MNTDSNISNSILYYAGNIDFNNSPHDKFIAESAKLAGIVVKMADVDSVPHIKGCPTLWMLDDKQIVFDWQDWQDFCQSDAHIEKAYFKSHHLINGYGKFNTFPTVPIMTFPKGDLENYYMVRNTFRYKCIGNKINNKQIPYGRAAERRRNVNNILKSNFSCVDINGKEPVDKFWKKHENCISAVCVPGATNNMLDREHLELIGLGVCTISPNIPTKLPYDKTLISGVHYLQCKDDYSDLINILRWCTEHRTDCEAIGQNARALFENYLTPIKQWQWIKYKTEEFYANKE